MNSSQVLHGIESILKATNGPCNRFNSIMSEAVRTGSESEASPGFVFRIRDIQDQISRYRMNEPGPRTVPLGDENSAW
jgi:hypothetical protein